MFSGCVTSRIFKVRGFTSVHHKCGLLNTLNTTNKFSKQLILLLSNKTFPPHMLVKLPALSPTMTHGTIQSWDVEVGNRVDEGDQLASMETDKATMALEAPETGFLAKILVPAGTKDIPVRQVICVLVDDEKDIPAFAEFTVSEMSSQPIEGIKKEVKELISQPAMPTNIRASPLAKRLAKERGIRLENLTSSRKDGILSGNDVTLGQSKAPILDQSKVSKRTSDFVDIPLSKMREIISTRLLESKQTIPHYYLTLDVTMDQAMQLRKKLNNSGSVKLSINDLVIKASALSCLRHMEMNCSFHGTFIRRYNNVDMCVAVDTPDGLITPIVKNAHTLGLDSINKTVRDLAGRARERKLMPEDYQGGTFTISNLGMFGIDQFCAIINPPQSGILAVGRIRKTVMVDADNEHVLGNVMTVTLSCDHRVVDGAVGAKWLGSFKQLMETPELMLL